MQKLISHTKAPREQRDRYHSLLYLRSVDVDRQVPPLSRRPGHQEANIGLVDMQKQSGQDLAKQVKRKRLHNELNPSLQGYLEWLSSNWAELFAEKTKTASLIFLLSVVFNILVELKVVVFELARMTSTQLEG